LITHPILRIWPRRLPPVPWTEKAIERSPFFVRRGGHCCRGDLVGRTTLWFFLSGLQKSEQRAKKCIEQRTKKCIELRGEYAEWIPSFVAVACFLGGRAKDLSALPRKRHCQYFRDVEKNYCIVGPTPLHIIENHANYYPHENIISGICIRGTGWRWVIGFKRWSRDPQNKCPSYPMNRKLAGPNSTFGTLWIKILPAWNLSMKLMIAHVMSYAKWQIHALKWSYHITCIIFTPKATTTISLNVYYSLLCNYMLVSTRVATCHVHWLTFTRIFIKIFFICKF